MNKTSFSCLFLLVIVAVFSCEEFNLYGEAGQAYSLEIYIGHPRQKLKVLVDTGSTTLSMASYARKESNIYFHSDNSSTLYTSGKEIQARYSQGSWVGHLVSDFVSFPSVPLIPEVRSDIALIFKSHKFFMNGSGWQGLLGLAYLPVGAWGDSVVVGSWLDSVEKALNRPVAFLLKLCGIESPNNATHYGRFDILDESSSPSSDIIYRTPILRKRWYEIGVVGIRTITKHSKTSNNALNGTLQDTTIIIDKEICMKLNKEKSIVDSGTTSIRLPDDIFTKVVNVLRAAAQTANMLIWDEFWYHGEATCWPEPQEWSLPAIAIDLLSFDSENEYFTLEIPPQNFMRVITARNNSMSGRVSEFCYKLGLDPGGKETVLGYTAMEGLQVIFNRSGGWVGWKPSDCGPNSRITGPFNISSSLLSLCELSEPVPDVAESIQAAQWTLFVLSLIAAAVTFYLLSPCIRILLGGSSPRTQQFSLSQTSLVEQET